MEVTQERATLKSIVNTVYLITNAGVEILVGPDAKEFIETIEKGDRLAYTFYENGRPVYGGIKDSPIRPLIFPEPGSEKDKYGITSPELYAKGVTYAEIVSRIIQLQTKTKPGFMDQIKKAMTLATPIVAMAFIIFIMAVALGG